MPARGAGSTRRPGRRRGAGRTEKGRRRVLVARAMRSTRAPRGARTLLWYQRLSGWARLRAGALAAGAVVALVSGCAVGPEFHRPPAPALPSYARPSLAATTAATAVTGGAAQRFVPDQELAAQWWTLFQSPPLTALMEKALQASPTLVAAQAALRQALELVTVQRGAYYPTIQASFSPSQQKASGNLSPPLSGPELSFSLYTAQATLSWMLDVFGGNRRQVEALLGTAEAQRFMLEAASLTLTTSLASAAIQEASVRAQLAATHEIIAISTQSLELTRRRYALGDVAQLDVAAQEAALAQVQLTLPPLQKQLEQTRDLLAALAGRFPSEPLAETFELAGLQLPEELPVGLPATLVVHRPDVRVAEAQLHAASAQIGVALANRLPQFTITAAGGGLSTSLTQMFVNS